MARLVTVRDLIAQLEAIENKDLDVVIDSATYGALTDVEAIEGVHRYYGKNEGSGMTWKNRECVVLIAWE